MPVHVDKLTYICEFDGGDEEEISVAATRAAASSSEQRLRSTPPTAPQLPHRETTVSSGRSPLSALLQRPSKRAANENFFIL